MKRMIDFVVAIILFFLLLPIFLVISTLIYLKLGSPVYFKQERAGFLGKPFYIYKFRTMTDEVDSSGKALDDEVRFTSFGNVLRKFSLDEFPQLWNIVKGDMSFVGPRPLLMEYLGLYNENQVKRLKIRPGITGWAQVNGRNEISWEDRLRLDVWYVENRSCKLDCKILIKTVIKVLKSEGISQGGHTTMPLFKGEKGIVK